MVGLWQVLRAGQLMFGAVHPHAAALIQLQASLYGVGEFGDGKHSWSIPIGQKLVAGHQSFGPTEWRGWIQTAQGLPRGLRSLKPIERMSNHLCGCGRVIRRVIRTEEGCGGTEFACELGDSRTISTDDDLVEQTTFLGGIDGILNDRLASKGLDVLSGNPLASAPCGNQAQDSGLAAARSGWVSLHSIQACNLLFE